MGKSTLCLDLAARVTTGRPPFDQGEVLVPPSAVVLMAAEDGLADTIRPRLDAAGADPELVHHLDAVSITSEQGKDKVVWWVPPSLPDHVDALRFLVIRTGAVLVIVDVLMAYLSGQVDAHRDQDARRALSPLGEMAEDTGACVVLPALPKSQRHAGQAIVAGSGGVGIVRAARGGIVVGLDRSDETGQRRVLARAKGTWRPPTRRSPTGCSWATTASSGSSGTESAASPVISCSPHRRWTTAATAAAARTLRRCSDSSWAPKACGPRTPSTPWTRRASKRTRLDGPRSG